MKYTRLARSGYQLNRDNSAVNAKWNLSLPSIPKGKSGFYIYGRDYDEILPNLNQRINGGKSIILDPRSPNFSPLIESKLSVDRLQFILRYNRVASELFEHGDDLREASTRSPDAFLNKLRTINADIVPAIGLISEIIDILRMSLSRHKDVTRCISLDALENTYFLLCLTSCVNYMPNGEWIIIGPQRCATAFNLAPIERPYLLLSDATEIAAARSGTSLLDVNNKLESWISTWGTKSDFRRGLSMRETEGFLRWVKSETNTDDYLKDFTPPQVAAPLSVSVQDDRLVALDVAIPDGGPLDVLHASFEHLASIIRRIEENGNLSNWDPFAQDKLRSVSETLSALTSSRTLDVKTCIRFGLDVESLRETVARSSEELMPAISHEFSIFFLQANLALQQLSPWQVFVQNAANLSWGQNCSPGFSEALKDVYERLMRADDKFVDSEIKAYAASVTTSGQMDAPHTAGATLSLRNILSASIRFLLQARTTAGKILEERASEAFRNALSLMFEGMQYQLLTIAREYPSTMGWIEEAARMVGWIK